MRGPLLTLGICLGSGLLFTSGGGSLVSERPLFGGSVVFAVGGDAADGGAGGAVGGVAVAGGSAGGVVQLPPPSRDGDMSVEQSLFLRVSRRNFGAEPLSLAELGQLVWAAQGINVDGVTGASRTAPSAGATDPIDIYVVAGNVTGLAPGLYRYERQRHRLQGVAAGDIRNDVAATALRQRFIARAPASIVLAAEYERTTGRYGERGIRYVHMEVGHITQNIYLQAEALKLGAVAVGAFIDRDLKALLKISGEPLMIIPVGRI